MRNTKRAAIVTGGSRGIGNAIALRLLEDGFAVAITGTRPEAQTGAALDNLKKHEDFIYIQADVKSPEDRRKTIEQTLSRFSRLDVLVNNAGVAPKVREDLLFTSEESFDYVVGTNLRGGFFMTQAAANAMIKQLSAGAELSPVIVNISSVSAYTASVNRGEYCISKAGISMVTALFADRLAEYGINVYEVRPGIIETDMTSAVKDKYDALIAGGLTPIRRWGKPEDVAAAVSVLCSGALAFSTGEVINVDGGFHIRRL